MILEVALRNVRSGQSFDDAFPSLERFEL